MSETAVRSGRTRHPGRGPNGQPRPPGAAGLTAPYRRLSVLVRLDLAARHVRLVVTGFLTEPNHHALHALVRRARHLVPGGHVVVDLGQARHLEDAAVELLRRAVEHDGAGEPASTVDVVLPPPTGRPGADAARFAHPDPVGALRA